MTRAQPNGVEVDWRADQHGQPSVSRIPTTRAQLALSRPVGTPGAVLPPLRRAAPDRTIWRAPELKDLPPDLAEWDEGRPAPQWKVPDPQEHRGFARRTAPRPPTHRTPSGFTRRAWRRYDPVSLGLSAEELGLTLPVTVDLSQGVAASLPPPSELADLAIARRTGELVNLEPETFETPDAGAVDCARPAQVVLPANSPAAAGDAARSSPRAPLVIESASVIDRATVASGPHAAHATARGHAQRGRIRTLISGRDVQDGVAAEQPATVPLGELVTVVAAGQHRADADRARAASSRAVASPRRRAERNIAGGVALLVLIASFVGVSPFAAPSAGTGNVGREATPPMRIAIGALSNPGDGMTGSIEGVGDAGSFASREFRSRTEDETSDGLAASRAGLNLTPVATANPNLSSLPSAPAAPLADRYLQDEQPTFGTDDQGPFNADGTLVKPIAVDTTVPDGKEQLRTYKVKKGDTALEIAKRFKVTTATVVWSNNLEDAPALKIGQTLVIPPVNGLVHVVKDGDTLSAIARRTNVDFRKIMEVNGLTETTVFIGQTLIIPGGKGEHIGTPPAAAGTDLSPDNPARRNSVTLPRRTTASPPRATATTRVSTTYTGGGFAWPFPGGSISQYYNAGHGGMDIAGPHGLPIVAAADGVVTFAGWKNNGGGWQVWISHGSGMYTTYNHMSGVSVGAGQAVAKGQRVGSNGMSGMATGPHVHFEVWLGPVWNGGQRVNPGAYL